MMLFDLAHFLYVTKKVLILTCIMSIGLWPLILFKGNLKDQYRTLKKQYFTAKGLPTKNKKIQWLFDWRTNAFSDDFAAID